MDRARAVVLDAEPTILDATVVLDVDEAAEPPTPVTAHTEKVLAKLEGSITVRERLRALPRTGQRLRLCHGGTGRPHYWLQMLSTDGHGSSVSWPVTEELRMETEGLHSSSPSAKLVVPAGANAPMRAHGRTASTPPPDEVLLSGSAAALQTFLGEVRKVLKELKALQRRGTAPQMRVKCAKVMADATPRQGGTQPAASAAPTAAAPNVSEGRPPGPARGDQGERRDERRDGKFMSPALMECKPGLGSGNGLSARAQAKQGVAMRQGQGRGQGQARAAQPPTRHEPPAEAAAEGQAEGQDAVASGGERGGELDTSKRRRTQASDASEGAGPSRPILLDAELDAAPADAAGVPPRGRGGLANLGNTCYLNSVLQGLASCATFVSHVEALSRAPRAEGGEVPLSARLLPLLLPGRVASSSSELRQLKRAVSQKRAAFEGSAQHDAHELLCELLGRIEAEVAAAPTAPTAAAPAAPTAPTAAAPAAPTAAAATAAATPAAAATRPGDGDDAQLAPQGGAAGGAAGSAVPPCPVSRCFGFRLCTTLCCDACGHSSSSVEPFSHLSLRLPAEVPPAALAPPVVPHAAQPEAGEGGEGGQGRASPVASPRSLQAILQAHSDINAGSDHARVRTPPRPPRPPRQRGRTLVVEAQARAEAPDEEEEALAAAIAASLAPPPAATPAPPPPVATSTVQELLDLFLGEEAREWVCSACGHGSAVARQRLLGPPEVLLLHLSRFEADPATGMAHKRHTPVALDLTLRLRHAPAAAAAAAERTPHKASSPETVPPAPPGAAPPSSAAASSVVSSYELRAVVSHLGQRCYHGHYKCVERDSEGWLEYDDACVTPLGFDPTAHDEHSRGAYILFYQSATEV